MHQVRELLDRGRLADGDVPRSDFSRSAKQQESVDKVVGVKKVSFLKSISVNGETAPQSRSVGEGGDDRPLAVRVLAWPVDIRGSSDGVRDE